MSRSGPRRPRLESRRGIGRPLAAVALALAATLLIAACGGGGTSSQEVQQQVAAALQKQKKQQELKNLKKRSSSSSTVQLAPRSARDLAAQAVQVRPAVVGAGFPRERIRVVALPRPSLRHIASLGALWSGLFPDHPPELCDELQRHQSGCLPWRQRGLGLHLLSDPSERELRDQ